MHSDEAPRLRVVAGGGLSSGGVGRGARGGRLRAVGHPPGRSGSEGGTFDWRAELELVAPDVLLPPGCSREAIAAAEGSLGWSLPPQQVEFIAAADGVYDVDSHHWYAWSLERLVEENFEPERPSDLLLVGDDAASGWFCLPLRGSGGLHYNRVTGERRTLARDLRGLWLGWFGGTIGV
jgi:SMI1/KNR4 family protein SUKH-1